jgi:DNA-directed RNA polymerase subunit RPC12/RpoP
MTWGIAILIFVIVIILDNTDFLTLRKCPKCGSVFSTTRVKRTDHGSIFAKPGRHRILIDYKCGKCSAKWTSVREENQKVV